MKKLLVLSLILAVSFTLAAEEGEVIGLSLGLEVGIVNINKANGTDMEPYIMPMIIYEQSFLDGALDIYAELDYTVGFTEVINEDNNGVFPQSLYFDFMIGYNFGLSDTSTLSIILENEFDEVILEPRIKESNNITGIFTPAVNFNQELDFGDIYAKIGLPITYIQEYKDADTLVGLDFTFGWSSTFGLGLEVKALSLIAPGDDAGYVGLEALISYESDSIYFEVLTEIPKDISAAGITITPEFDYLLGNFTFYVYCEFSGIGIDGGSVVISPAMGIKYSF